MRGGAFGRGILLCGGAACATHPASPAGRTPGRAETKVWPITHMAGCHTQQPALTCRHPRRRRDAAGGSVAASSSDSREWACFYTQAAAFTWADSQPAGAAAEPLAFWSFEDQGSGGRRRFVAASYAAFWARYSGLPAHHRHHYELLREARPVHLYFDLDASLEVKPEPAKPMLWRAQISAVSASLRTQANPQFNGAAAVAGLVALTNEHLLEKLGAAPDEADWVELDSSTRAKFSRHLICHLPHGRAFQSTAAAGTFVRALMARTPALCPPHCCRILH